jgi:acyl-coenzyme A thioesterase PaaI-like protein
VRGSLNVEGLGLALHVDGDTCWTELALPDRFEGWEGIAHGGIVCTILDEVMAWSLAARDTWSLTARMTVDFKRPVRIGVPIRRRSSQNARRRLMDTAARLVDPSSGELLATAEAVYVVAAAEQPLTGVATVLRKWRPRALPRRAEHGCRPTAP